MLRFSGNYLSCLVEQGPGSVVKKIAKIFAVFSQGGGLLYRSGYVKVAILHRPVAISRERFKLEIKLLYVTNKSSFYSLLINLD